MLHSNFSHLKLNFSHFANFSGKIHFSLTPGIYLKIMNKDGLLFLLVLFEADFHDVSVTKPPFLIYF